MRENCRAKPIRRDEYMGTELKVRRAGLRSGAVLFAAMLVGLVRVVSAEPTPSGARELRVPPVAFHPANSGSNYVVEEGGLGRLCASRGAGYFVAPVALDDGMVIDAISVFVDDDNADALGMMSLVRCQPGAFEVLALTPVSAGTGETEVLSTTAISPAVVDSRKGSYVLQVLLTGPGVCVRRAQVTYHAP